VSAHGPVRHEGRDVEPRAIRRAGLLLLAVTIGAMLILIPFLRVLERASVGADAEPGPLAFEPDRRPPGPQLQQRPTLDLKALRAEERAILEGYGWVDRDAGVVRVPIERAMELLVQRQQGGGETSAEPGGRQ
jgi:hypothetical protein